MIRSLETWSDTPPCADQRRLTDDGLAGELAADAIAFTEDGDIIPSQAAVLATEREFPEATNAEKHFFAQGLTVLLAAFDISDADLKDAIADDAAADETDP